MNLDQPVMPNIPSPHVNPKLLWATLAAFCVLVLVAVVLYFRSVDTTLQNLATPTNTVNLTNQNNKTTNSVTPKTQEEIDLNKINLTAPNADINALDKDLQSL